jgi:molecular chaperone GrpE
LHERKVRALVEPLLGLNDNFRAMVEHVPADLQGHPWVQGAVHIARQLNDILAEFQVTVIEPTGEPFDPRFHEAVEHIADTSQPPGTVVSVVQAGYRLNETVVRPAKVKVAA